MTGAEIAGLALAVLPILVAAAQHYNNCLGPFGRYRKFAKEARNYYQELEVQRIIFRNGCRNLLEGVVDHDAASGMLNSLTQQAWSDKRLDEQLAQQLGESLEACKAVIELIEQRLRDISGESLSFKSVVEQEKQSTPKPIRDKLWKRNLGEKLRLSFSKSRLDENIAKLRSHNDDLRILASQACQAVPKTRLAHPKLSRANDDDYVRKCRIVREASCQIYDALRKACTKHLEHIAHFPMGVEHIFADRESSPQVRFDMTFSHRVSTGSPGPEDPIWFLIDSILDEHKTTCSNKPSACVAELEISLKRQLAPTDTPMAPTAKKAMKNGHLVSATPAKMPSPYLPLVATSLLRQEECIGKNFCNDLRRHFRRPMQGNAYVVLEATANCRHLVYPSQFAASLNTQRPKSLRRLMRSTTAPDVVGGILLHERILLAKMLAVAVLQYHATPWLPLSWRSEDILFFAMEENSSLQLKPNLTAPYIRAKVQGQNVETPAQNHLGVARNPTLFSLGVVLLELAHGASLKTLVLPVDADGGGLDQEFFAARQLAKAKRTVMGPVYNDIVEQLVECVFPLGGDLNEPELQATFYQDVICPLDKLEQGFRELYIGGDGS